MKTLSLLRGFTIRTRMLGAIALVLCMFALVGAAGLFGGLALQRLNGQLIDHSIAELLHITEMRSQLAKVRLHEKQMVIDYEDGTQVLKHREQWTAAIAATRQALEAMLEGEEDEDNPLARDSIEQLAAYEKASQPVLLQIQDGGYDNIRVVDKMLARAKEHVARVEKNVDQIDAIVGTETRATQAEFAQALQTVLMIFAGTLAA